MGDSYSSITKWMQKPSRLLKKLEQTKDPGKRLKLIREAKNSTAAHKGNFGFRALCTYLAEQGVVTDDTSGRNIVKGIEGGIRKGWMTKEPALVEPWLKWLDIDIACLGEAQPAEKEPPALKTSSRKAAPAAKLSSPQKITFYNHCEGLQLEFHVEYYLADGSIHVRIFNDEPTPDKYKEPKKGVVQDQVWVPEPTVKYVNSPNPEDRKPIARQASVTLK